MTVELIEFSSVPPWQPILETKPGRARPSFQTPLLRATQRHRRLAELEAEWQTLRAALDCMETSVFVLGAQGAICKCNRAAAALLAKANGLIVNQGRLAAANAKANAKFAKLVLDALAEEGARGGVIALPRQALRPLFARIMPFATNRSGYHSNTTAHAIVFVSDPDAEVWTASEEVMDGYGLTPSEKKLLKELLAGQSLREAASKLIITRLTARNRLSRIMDRTGTRRQTDLLQLILRSRIPAL